MCQCPERSGWRKTRSACPRTCVSVRAPGDGRGGLDGTDGPTAGQKDRPLLGRGAGRGGGAASRAEARSEMVFPRPPEAALASFAPSHLQMALKSLSFLAVISLRVHFVSDYDILPAAAQQGVGASTLVLLGPGSKAPSACPFLSVFLS